MNNTNNQLNNFEDEIDLIKLFNIVWKGKIFIILITSFISILAVIYSLSLPNIYESKALLSSVGSSYKTSSPFESYRGLAGLAGINVSSSSDESNSAQAKKKLTSLSFFEDNLLPNIFLPDLMAIKSWDLSTNKVIYNKSIYNSATNEWVRTYDFPQKSLPSAQESFKKFYSEHFSFVEDKTGFITLSINHKSPHIAKQWIELVVNQINFFYRERDKATSERSINFLNTEISKTNFTEVKQAISELLKHETQKLALIEANQNYVFDYIDPPAVMEKKSKPNRSLISILGAALGSIIGIIFVIFKHYFFLRKNANL